MVIVETIAFIVFKWKKFLLATLKNFADEYAIQVFVFTSGNCHSCESRNPFLQRESFIFLDSRLRGND